MADEKDYFEEQPEDEPAADAGDPGEGSDGQGEAQGLAESPVEYVEAPAEAGAPEVSPKNWYIIHTYSGF